MARKACYNDVKVEIDLKSLDALKSFNEEIIECGKARKNLDLIGKKLSKLQEATNALEAGNEDLANKLIKEMEG